MGTQRRSQEIRRRQYRRPLPPWWSQATSSSPMRTHRKAHFQKNFHSKLPVIETRRLTHVTDTKVSQKSSKFPTTKENKGQVFAKKEQQWRQTRRKPRKPSRPQVIVAARRRITEHLSFYEVGRAVLAEKKGMLGVSEARELYASQLAIDCHKFDFIPIKMFTFSFFENKSFHNCGQTASLPLTVSKKLFPLHGF